MFCFRQTFCVCKHKKTIPSYRMGQKLSSKLLFIYSPNSDGFYIFQFHKVAQCSVVQYGGMYSNHLITNFPQNAPVKKNLRIGQYLTRIWTKLCGLLFWATMQIGYCMQLKANCCIIIISFVLMNIGANLQAELQGRSNRKGSEGVPCSLAGLSELRGVENQDVTEEGNNNKLM